MKQKLTFWIPICVILVCVILLSVFVPLGVTGYFLPDYMSINTREKEAEEVFDPSSVSFQKVTVSTSTKGSYAVFTFLLNEKEYQIKFYLLSDYAPETVKVFTQYITQQAYVGTSLYRAEVSYGDDGEVSNAYLQGGMYKRGEKGLTYCEPSSYQGKIKGEFPANGFTGNNISLTAGVLCMARNSKDYNSADTEFFFLPKGNTSLNGYYAPFAIIADTKDNDTLCTLAKAVSKGSDVTIKSLTLTTTK